MQNNHKHPKAKKGTFLRLVKLLLSYYRGLWVVVLLCIGMMAISNATASILIKEIATIVDKGLDSGVASVKDDLFRLMIIMIVIYVSGVTASIINGRTMATITQGTLKKIRCKMFNGMQQLPIKYFDTHNHGDIMSVYTNDIDSLRQMISQSIPQLVQSSIMLVLLLGIMSTYSFWLAIIVLFGIFSMRKVAKKIGGRAAQGFIRQQQMMGKVEGYVEEMMHGQKVVKVFCHEDMSKEEFDKINEELFLASEHANKNANVLMPVLNNIGNIMYVLVAFVGGILIALSLADVKIYNLTITGLTPISISYFLPIAIAFLTLTRQFSNNISQLSNQLNSIIMALAGAERIFTLIDEEKEIDNGYVTLVNVEYDEDGNMKESIKRTGMWAWKHPHSDGTLTYTKLQGDIRMYDVDFGYDENKIVLHNITLYAKPGQKVAFVGATGAGKTTITNLINRFYDIADGKIRYDGININKIKKEYLRKSLGIVLQDTNLFTGTVMDNIRYGKLDATDEDCIAAAKLANAHDFITRLPQGYDTLLTSDGSNLSQGQRQLISIARAAVADAPVMILDEATSSIDTRTEALVQKGTDRLMEGRTIFVIAHRLSTVQNSDAIMVLEQGRIIERGSHAELIDKHGKYYQLYTGAFELE